MKASKEDNNEYDARQKLNLLTDKHTNIYTNTEDKYSIKDNPRSRRPQRRALREVSRMTELTTEIGGHQNNTQRKT